MKRLWTKIKKTKTCWDCTGAGVNGRVYGLFWYRGKSQQKENILRGEGLAADFSKRTHCKNGHEYTNKNTTITYGWRRCNECNRINARESYRISISRT